MTRFGKWMNDRPGTAAWVQAIGALVGLAIAIGLPAYQNHATAVREAAQEERVRQAAWLQLRDSGVDVIDVLMDAKRQLAFPVHEDKYSFQYSAWLFEDARQNLRAIRHDLLDDRALMTFADIRQCLGEAGRLLSHRSGSLMTLPERDRFLAEVQQQLDKVSRYADSASTASGRYAPAASKSSAQGG